jgi:hypothetical protein
LSASRVLRASDASSLAFLAKDPACLAASARLSELGLNPFSFGIFGFGIFGAFSFGIGTPSTFERRLRLLRASPPAIPAIPTPAASAGPLSFFAVVATALPALSTGPLLCDCAELRLRLEGLVRFEALLLLVLPLLDERLLCERELERGFAVERPLAELRVLVDELRVFERPLVELRLDALLLLRLEPLLVVRPEPLLFLVVRLEPLLVC